jgi:protein Tex
VKAPCEQLQTFGQGKFMNQQHILQTAEEISIQVFQVEGTAKLIAEGASVPFIARYRKEITGSLDEVVITSIRDRLNQLEELDGRKSAILKSLEQNGHLTEELKEKVLIAPTISVLEDIYLPFRPKRRTRGTIAREKGLEPLALQILEQKGTDPVLSAKNFIDTDKGVETENDALAGARDIIAEMVNEDETARARLRRLFFEKAVFTSRVASGKETEGIKYQDYFDWQEPASSTPSHRILAMRRGEKEEMLNLNVSPSEKDAIDILEKLFIKSDGPDAQQVKMAVHDAYKRLLSRSMETELRLATKQRADADAIRIFAENLRHLLMAPPLGPKRVMGIDPGFRTGCKIACLDRQGKLLHYDTVYLHMSEDKERESAEKIKKLCRQFEIEAIAVGNGTAGRETQTFIQNLNIDAIPVLLVNEAGASVYSASEAARREFPDLDLTIRGAVSIGRRLMDPLSELVKIDPKSIGVGQYQHDVDQIDLKKSLDDMVISCVNAVGVDVNRASVELLTYVSGLGPSLAGNIVSFRNENGAFCSRKELKKVPRLGPKAFEQCAGFLRIQDGTDPLDAGAVHPESYPVVEAMAGDLNCSVADLIKTKSLRDKIDINRYITDTIGIPTLTDIMLELDKPGRDPRESFDNFAFAAGIQKIGDLRPGMSLPGIVTNVTAFGAFVDVGVHQDGLVHISELADRFVKNPSDVVRVHQKVKVKVLEIDVDRKRIALSMRQSPIPDVSENPKNKKDLMSTSKTIKKAKNNIKKQAHIPFNNPFADLFGKDSK